MLGFVIDNFLPEDVFQSISNKVSRSPQFTIKQWTIWRDDFTKEILDNLYNRCKNNGPWLDHWEETFYKWSDQVAYVHIPNDRLPAGHMDNGGFVFYVHPRWKKNWGGRFYIEPIKTFVDPLPNRFLYINPKIPHAVEPLTAKVKTNRMTVVGFPEGTILQSHIHNQKQLQVYLRP